MNINNLLSGGPAPSKPPPPPPPPQPQQQQTHHQVHQNQQQSLPSTPVQGIPPQSFRDYGHHPQGSPTRGLSQEYAAHQIPQGPYGSPQAFQYAGRPAPPPLQPLSSNDVRSPGPGSILAPGPSPYRPTPISSISSTSGGYPFPAPQQTPTSPAQRHQYPPTGAYPARDGYPQAGGAMVGTGAQGPSSYIQGPPMPQTPPIGTPGGTHPYLQQRASSTYSATPTSATNHQQYGPPFGSPITATHPPPPYPEHARQQSQPPTPLGPPPRQASGPHNYAQPPSPYQQRISSSGSAYPPSMIHQISPRLHHPQVSPSAPAPSSIPRVPSNHSIYDNPVRVDSHRGSQSQSERDRSLSVSPKTRVSDLEVMYGPPGSSRPESKARTQTMNSISMPIATSNLEPTREMERSDRAVTPAKRKLEDRDLSRDELEKQDVRPPPFETPNGYESKPDAMELSRASASPIVQRRKRVRYSTPPVWAQRHVEGIRLNAGNFVLRKHAHNVGTQANGKIGSFSKPELASRQTSPEEKRSIAPSQPPPGANSAPAPVGPPPPPYEIPNKDGPLGPWESCITGTPPFDEVSNVVADFLFMKVVKNEDMGEIMSRNVQFEIEAKMGTLISKDTNERVSLPVLTECVLVDNGRVAFQSNMSEAQHKSFNDYLNLLVVETHPEAPRIDKDGRPKPPRVPIMYKHRRETDKFFELPPSMRARLPACVQHRIPAKHSVKVRVTYDQTTGKVIAMIIKARVADLDLYIPTCAFDCRISVNLEMDWDGSLEELEREAVSHDASPDRRKDRLSYTQSHYQIDLTQVTHTVAGLHVSSSLH
ncbi:mRNA triphosphatase CET1 [Coniochaeta ligniaria NRRL 30616]|uniref:mRNA-capping enzyme subunit beta n=1 Tax=Coniochaeta ligniaria NRRL 30616 TaxID=1408157 RepID=A0A1J7IYN9_9PEZI|nr:mRNA triphosphatase CET1 [Coniochaeta ligniaria NRRL 30616]